SAFRVLTRVALLPFDKFEYRRTIRRVRCPVLVIHGTRDEVIPYSHGQQLYEAANQRKQSLWIDGAGHNDLEQVGDARDCAAFARRSSPWPSPLGSGSPARRSAAGCGCTRSTRRSRRASSTSCSTSSSPSCCSRGSPSVWASASWRASHPDGRAGGRDHVSP